jgi:hypothetical protein
MTIPIVMGAAGAIATPPATLLANLIAAVAAVNPGYTATLPGTLIEDIASTDVAAIAVSDSALVDIVNSVTPLGANQFLLNELGQIYGVPQGLGTNASVYVVFTGSLGFIVSPGFLVSDGTNTYAVQQGGIIAHAGSPNYSDPLYCVAVQYGTWAIPANTVNQIATSVPSPYTVNCNNPLAGTPATSVQAIADYRAQVLQAGLASSLGTVRYLKTLLGNVPGVQSRLISISQASPGWKVICGGSGNPYNIATAIFQAMPDISNLAGSVTSVVSATQASVAVITTSLWHGLTTGNSVTISGALGMTGINGTWTVTVLTQTTFSIPYNSGSAPAYTGGGTIANTRTQTVSVVDWPDTYSIPFVTPPQQYVAISLVWNTNSTNAVSASGMASLGGAALVSYINSIPVGQPINLFELQNAFQIATASILATPLLTKMLFTVTIAGYTVAPATNTGIIAGDPESYFQTDLTQISVTQG